MAGEKFDFRRELSTHQTFLLSRAKQRTRDYHDAKDLVQKTNLRALEAERSFTPGTNMRGWLTTIMVNTHLTGLQDTKRHKSILQKSWHPPENTPPAQITAVEYGEVRRAIQKLSVHHQLALARAVEHEKTGVPLRDGEIRLSNTQKSHTKRARAALRQLGDWGR
ncbi:MAG: RNA polymerase sigma factor [Patescibacteria group bacterium]